MFNAGYKFGIIDGLITNFHLPECTVVMLVSALAGTENVLNAYKEAIEKEYAESKKKFLESIGSVR